MRSLSNLKQYCSKDLSNLDFSSDDSNGIEGKGMIDGIMAGRWILRRPLDLYDIDDQFSIRGSDNRKKSQSRVQAILKYTEYAHMHILSKAYSASEVMTPLVLVVEQLKEDYDRLYPRNYDDDFDIRIAQRNLPNRSVQLHETGTQLAMGSMSEEEIWAIFRAVWNGVSLILGEKGKAITGDTEGGGSGNDPPFRKLSKLLSQASGKKVTSKIIKNRAEDTNLVS